MKQTAIFTLTSVLNDQQAVDTAINDFLSDLGVDYDLKGEDYTEYGKYALNIIYICTGGTEYKFVNMLPELRTKSKAPFYLLTSGKRNSLAASLEILSFLRQQGIGGEVIHGDHEYVCRRLHILEKAGQARQTLRGARAGIIGKPSDWLVASHADRGRIKECLGIDLLDIPMDELFEALPVNKSIYAALLTLIDRHRLQGFTLRCFDLINTLHDTGCLPLARLNAQGYVAGCEGDVPSMISMMIVRSLTGVSGFLANPASINSETGELLFAHCTIPLDMVERYELGTHFESGIGTGVRGFMKEGPVTVFKVSGDLSQHYIAEGKLVMNLDLPDICRTQQLLQLDDRRQATYFLSEPIGNHHIIIPGHHRELLEEMVKSF